MENLVCRETKCFHAIFKETKKWEIVRRLKTKKRISKYQDKKEGNLRELYFKKEWSEDFNKFIIEEKDRVWNFNKLIGSSVRQLIKIRNQIINATIELQTVMDDSPFYTSYTKKDMANMLELVDDLKGTSYWSPHFLWDVPNKTHDNELYEEGELSDEENRKIEDLMSKSINS